MLLIFHIWCQTVGLCSLPDVKKPARLYSSKESLFQQILSADPFWERNVNTRYNRASPLNNCHSTRSYCVLKWLAYACVVHCTWYVDVEGISQYPVGGTLFELCLGSPMTGLTYRCSSILEAVNGSLSKGLSQQICHSWYWISSCKWSYWSISGLTGIANEETCF